MGHRDQRVAANRKGVVPCSESVWPSGQKSPERREVMRVKVKTQIKAGPTDDDPILGGNG